MAHGDYWCCIVCDQALVYGGHDAECKQLMCGECAEALFARGVGVATLERFVRWVEETDADTVERVLREVGYRPCHYWQWDVAADLAVRERLGERWEQFVENR